MNAAPDSVPTVRLRTLGALELRGLKFARPKPLLLLAYLALEGVQERRFLAQLFWPDASDAMKSLTVALAQLRQGAPGVIEADGLRAWSRVPTDARDFLERLDHHEPEVALAAYGGPFSHGVPQAGWGVELEEWVFRTREYLADRARMALLNVAEREAIAGDFVAAASHAVGAYRMAGAGEPEPEVLTRLHALLMAGENPLAAEVRQALESVGVNTPLPESAIAARERWAQPVRAATSELPSRSTRLFGRRDELTHVHELLTRPDGRLLTLVGPAGVGKTRLALQAAHETLEVGAFADGVHFVPFETLLDPDAVLPRLSDALGLEVAAHETPRQALVRGIGQRSVLIVLDNLEHLSAGVAVLSNLLAACPNLRLLVTSRERLALEAETVVPVAGLPYPEDDQLEPSDAMNVHAVALFADRARRVFPEFRLDANTLPAVLQVCRAVAGLPLALELSAAWVRMMPVQEIAAELERGLDLLQSTSRDTPERHASVRTAFEASLKLLSPKERDVLCRLAVFRGGFRIGGFRREAASEVAGATIPVLAALVDKSFLQLDHNGRYHRHPLVFRFLQEKLAEQPQVEAQTRQKHAAYFLGMLDAARSKLSGPVLAETLQHIEEDLKNIGLAWDWAVREARWPLLENALEAVVVFHDRRNRHLEGLALLHTALEAIDPQPLRGKLLADAAWFEHRVGNLAKADTLAREAIGLLPSESDAALRARNVVASIAWQQGHHQEARDQWQRALQVVEAQGNARGIGRFLGNLAIAEQALGNTDTARRHLRRSLETARGLGDHLTVAHNLNRLGDLEFDEHHLEKANQLWQQGLEYAEQHGIENAVPVLLLNLGRVAAEHGEYEQAKRLLLQSLERSNDPFFRGRSLIYLAQVAMRRGDLDACQTDSRRALELALEINNAPVALDALCLFADLHATRGRFERAAILLEFVTQHPAADHRTKTRVQGALERLKNTLPDAVIENALTQAQHLTLQSAVLLT